ncbi:hypothetical protein NQ317_012842 [Molorchus minor]|uniref:Uncharacterized protein n=1 Tax=Molorchus minor TaxID=1323400 RepID=A0ABQ9ITJ5_9CUCU|nr:hypothetical protein NQ317_012842 [Molorchus minor]
MESDLLIKEDEFHKENKKLEERTKELMKKIGVLVLNTYRGDSKINSSLKKFVHSDSVSEISTLIEPYKIIKALYLIYQQE